MIPAPPHPSETVPKIVPTDNPDDLRLIAMCLVLSAVVVVITPSTKLMTLFSWRRIGRGVRENSSSPTWA